MMYHKTKIMIINIHIILFSVNIINIHINIYTINVAVPTNPVVVESTFAPTCTAPQKSKYKKIDL